MHIDNIDFPNFSRNDGSRYFPNSKGPGPILKKGCESPERLTSTSYFHLYLESAEVEIMS